MPFREMVMEQYNFKTIEEFAEIIGTDSSTLHVLLHTKRIDIPSYKFSRRLMFKESDIEEFIESRRDVHKNKGSKKLKSKNNENKI